MRHLTALQHTDGGWHYVSASRRGGYPIGFCADHPPHPTEEEARACYTAYEVEKIQLGTQLGDWSGCAALVDTEGEGEQVPCDRPTKTAAVVATPHGTLAALCAAHLTLEDAVKALGLTGPAGDAWVS